MKSLFPWFVAVGLALSSTAAFGQTAEQKQQQERIAASFVLALGRVPAADELEAWTKHGKLSVSDLVARHQQQLQSTPALKRATLVQAFQDTYGRPPTNEELNTWSTQNGNYTDLTKRLTASLAEDSAEFEHVLERAYRLIARRGVYREEIEYWKKHGTIPYALLVGCVEDWARRNQPGLMITAGTPTVSVNSHYLATVRLSPAIAEEARAAAGMQSLKSHYVEADYLGSTGRNLVAPGAEKIVSAGKIHFVAAGASNLLPAHGAN